VGSENAPKPQLTKRAYNYSVSLLPIGVKALKPTGYIANESLQGRFRAFQGIYAILQTFDRDLRKHHNIDIELNPVSAQLHSTATPSRY
jgi:hypothetical protein